MILMYPENGHFYVALKFQTLSNVVCSWIGAVQYFYVLHTTLMNGKSQKFASSKMLDLVNESVERLDVRENFEGKQSSVDAYGNNGDAENNAEIGSLSFGNIQSTDGNLKQGWSETNCCAFEKYDIGSSSEREGTPRTVCTVVRYKVLPRTINLLLFFSVHRKRLCYHVKMKHYEELTFFYLKIYFVLYEYFEVRTPMIKVSNKVPCSGTKNNSPHCYHSTISSKRYRMVQCKKSQNINSITTVFSRNRIEK